MNSNIQKPKVAFWIIASIALIWNLTGVMQFLMQAMNTEAFRSQYSPEELAIADALPSYYIVIFGIAVFASAIGAILLILRRKLSIPFLFVGFIAVLGQSAYNLFINEGRSALGPAAYIMLLVILLASFLIWWYSKYCKKKAYLK